MDEPALFTKLSQVALLTSLTQIRIQDRPILGESSRGNRS